MGTTASQPWWFFGTDALLGADGGQLMVQLKMLLGLQSAVWLWSPPFTVGEDFA